MHYCAIQINLYSIVFLGVHCEIQNSAHFVRDSFLHFAKFTQLVNLSMLVSANSSTGMILYTVSCFYLEIELQHAN